MVTLIVDYNNGYQGREVFPNLTIKEFGEKLVALSKQYVLCYDLCENNGACATCTFYVTVVAER